MVTYEQKPSVRNTALKKIIFLVNCEIKNLQTQML